MQGGGGKNFPQKFFPLPQEPSLIEHQIWKHNRSFGTASSRGNSGGNPLPFSGLSVNQESLAENFHEDRPILKSRGNPDSTERLVRRTRSRSDRSSRNSFLFRRFPVGVSPDRATQTVHRNSCKAVQLLCGFCVRQRAATVLSGCRTVLQKSPVPAVYPATSGNSGRVPDTFPMPAWKIQRYRT